MRAIPWIAVMIVAAAGMAAARQAAYQTDTFKTASGDLQIGFLGHSSLMFRYGEAVIYADPVSQYGDFASLPKADLILVTHEHGDHLDPKAIEAVRKEGTVLVGTAKCAAQVPGMAAIANGESRTVGGLKIEAVPAYNISKPFHPKGDGNGYVITFGDKRVYVAGDTENVPEIKALKNIDIAFLPMNLPYTMTPEMVADAAKAIAPRILYPYHYGSTETSRLVTLLANERGIELRIRNMR